jgi:hypothetical protein
MRKHQYAADELAPRSRRAARPRFVTPDEDPRKGDPGLSPRARRIWIARALGLLLCIPPPVQGSDGAAAAPVAKGTFNASAVPWGRYAIFQWRETRARVGGGVSTLTSGAKHDATGALSLRYRLSPAPWPLSERKPWRLGGFPLHVWLEAGSLLPHYGKALGDDEKRIDPFTVIAAEARLNWQVHLLLGGEIPLGKQRWIVPEIGAGIAAASLENSVATVFPGPLNTLEFSGGYFANQTRSRLAVGPYLRLGANFFADRIVSLRILGSYVHYANRHEVPLQYTRGMTPPRGALRETFDLSLAAWQIQPMVEFKWLWPAAAHVPLVPRALPPWLLPSYTTEEISPWVAPSDVGRDPRYQRPGQPTVGNVMFQYRNRWVERVELIGEFNDWTPERMIRDRSGIWVLVKDLPPGTYRYNYVINGKKEILDPWNKSIDPDSRAHGSSLVTVK